MPDAQARQLIEMMSRAPVQSHLEVCLPPFDIKRSSLEKLARGDILILQNQQFKVTILEEGNHIVGNGLYVNADGQPSVLIKESTPKPLFADDSNKYELLKISLGGVEKKEFCQGKIIKLHQDKAYDAILYRGKKTVAYASLVQVGKNTALQIGEVT